MLTACNKPSNPANPVEIPAGFPLNKLAFPTGSVRASFNFAIEQNLMEYSKVCPYKDGSGIEKTIWMTGFYVDMPVDSVFDFFEKEMKSRSFLLVSRENLGEAEKSLFGGRTKRGSIEWERAADECSFIIYYTESKSLLAPHKFYYIHCVKPNE